MAAGNIPVFRLRWNASASGDTVLVYPGRYYENITIHVDNVNLISLEALTGNSAYIDSTTIDGNNLSYVVSVTLNRQNIQIRGFSITNGLGTGLSIWPSTVSITNCHIYHNTASSGGGIVIAGAAVTLSGETV